MFRWDLNIEQAREVFHAAHDSLCAMMNSCRCHTQLYARLWKYLSSYSKLVDLCVWILFVVSEVASSMYGGFWGFKELLLSREAGPIRWHGMSCDYPTRQCFLRLSQNTFIFHHMAFSWWKDTEIEHVLIPAFLWDCTQHKVVIPFWCFGMTNRSHL